MSFRDYSVVREFHRKPFPFIKVLRKRLPFILLSICLGVTVMVLFMCKVNFNHFQFRNYSEDQIEIPSEPGVQSSNKLDSSNIDQDYISRKPLKLPSGEDPDIKVRAQRMFVKEMLKHSWDSYVKYGWGHNELKPLSRKGHTSEIFGGDHLLGATIVDSLSTLYIMNMTEEFERGRNWVQNNLDLSLVNSEMSVFETVIRFVGGLLSAFAFTKDQMFLEKAKHVADRMLPAFNTKTGEHTIKR